MSLNYDLSKVKDREALCFETATKDEPARGRVKGEQYLKAKASTLVWITMRVNLRGITKENAAKFWERLSFIEKVEGALLQSYDAKTKTVSPEYFTYEDVVAHIGLSVNVADETDAKWWAYQRKLWHETVTRDIRRKSQDK